MSVKVFQTNKAGKIEFTLCELEKLLNETYKEGYVEGHTDGDEAHAKKDYWTWTSPLVATITTNHVINEDTANTAAPNNVVQVEATTTLEVPEATKATINAKNVGFNMDEVDKLASALLGSGLFGSFNVNSAKKAVEETPFTKLAKELTTL